MKAKILSYIKTWESRCYTDGLPDECHPDIERNKLAPSYRQICIAIMKNDFNLKTLGLTSPASKYYGVLKRIELAERGICIQLSLF